MTTDELTEGNTRDELVDLARGEGVEPGARWSKARIARAVLDARSPGAKHGVAGLSLVASVSEGLQLRPDEVAILDTAGRVADTVAQLEDDLAASSTLVAGSTGQPVVNPLIGELRQQRALLASLLSRLNIPEPDNGQQQLQWDGLTSSQRARKAAHARWSA